jgi:16S rRNA (guanine527-N7)-methyltransferase
MEELIFNYFPKMTPLQKEQIKALAPVYKEWNTKVNVISRKDIDNIYLHHVLHSLAIAKHTKFPPGSSVMDVGTGGGFPGIPLAILFPGTNFFLCDSISKKVKVVNEVIKVLGLKNAEAKHTRAQEVDYEFDFVVSRAVTDLSLFIPLVWAKIIPSGRQLSRGIIYLKGGDLDQEIAHALKVNNLGTGRVSRNKVSEWFEEEWFKEKEVIFIKR